MFKKSIALLPLQPRHYPRAVHADPAPANRIQIQSRVADLREIEMIRLNMKELSHRMKNSAAVVLSLCRQTMSEGITKEEFDKRFSARLIAFCDSFDLLISNDWRGMDLHALIHSQIAHFAIGHETQFVISGPPVMLTPGNARCIGLALHELATNAVKYGALSVPGGKVSLISKIGHRAGTRHLIVEWSESGGPVVQPPTGRGFGSRLIGQAARASGGKVSYEFAQTGVRWTFEVELGSPTTLATH